MRAAGSTNQSHSMEISGWDLSDRFFVECTNLYVDASGATSAFLQASLRSGMLVFVRLLDGQADGAASPTAYRVGSAESAAGLCRVQLVPPKQFHVPGFEATSDGFERLIAQGSRIEVER